LRIKQLLKTVANTNSPMITFALFMIHSSYCKINEFHAKFSLLENLLNSHDTEILQNDFKLKDIFNEAYPIISEHLQCLIKATHKIPSWVSAGCVLAKKAYEQCTSEDIAQYRALSFKGKAVLSLTGGLGVDDYAFFKNEAAVISLDNDPCMNSLFKFNAKKLNATAITRMDMDAETYLKTLDRTFDLVFADPDRRPEGMRTAGLLDLHSPDVFNLYRLYKDCAPYWLFKLSPMTDISWLLNLVGISMDIEVIQQNSEVKELLCHVHSAAKQKVNLIDVSKTGFKEFDSINIVSQPEPGPFFIEPLPGLIKSGIHRYIKDHKELTARNSQQTYFTGACTLDPLIARSFKLIQEIEGGLSQVDKVLKGLNITKANISSREFVLSSEEIRNKLKLNDGGSIYLFFTGKSDKRCFICEKI
jgi:hypothetical protein